MHADIIFGEFLVNLSVKSFQLKFEEEHYNLRSFPNKPLN